MKEEKKITPTPLVTWEGEGGGGEERGVGESLMPSGAIKGPASTLKNQQRLIAPLHPNSLLNPASFSLFPPRF